MDPYLEDSAEWASFHSKYINSLSDQLAALVTPHFSVRMEQRVYILTPEDQVEQQIEPDLYLVPSRLPEQTGTTTPEISTPVLVQPLLEPELRERFIEIRDKRSREVITTIELLPPFNKAAGTMGRRAFMAKRLTVTLSPTH